MKNLMADNQFFNSAALRFIMFCWRHLVLFLHLWLIFCLVFSQVRLALQRFSSRVVHHTNERLHPSRQVCSFRGDVRPRGAEWRHKIWELTLQCGGLLFTSYTDCDGLLHQRPHQQSGLSYTLLHHIVYITTNVQQGSKNYSTISLFCSFLVFHVIKTSHL